MWYVHTHTYTHSGILRSQKKNEILLLATVWMDLDGTTVSEYKFHLYMEYKK